jgi:Ankyrin repeats (3 copies)
MNGDHRYRTCNEPGRAEYPTADPPDSQATRWAPSAASNSNVQRTELDGLHNVVPDKGNVAAPAEASPSSTQVSRDVETDVKDAKGSRMEDYWAHTDIETESEMYLATMSVNKLIGVPQATTRCVLLEAVDFKTIAEKVGKDDEAIGRHGRSNLLLFAASHGILSLAELMLDAGADVNFAAGKDHDHTSLHYAASNGHLEVTKLLLNRGAHVNSASDKASGHTPLHYAVRKDHREVVKLLLDRGADAKMTAGMSPGRTPLHCATVSGQVEVADLLSTQNVEFSMTRGSDMIVSQREGHWFRCYESNCGAVLTSRFLFK